MSLRAAIEERHDKFAKELFDKAKLLAQSDFVCALVNASENRVDHVDACL